MLKLISRLCVPQFRSHIAAISVSSQTSSRQPCIRRRFTTSGASRNHVPNEEQDLPLTDDEISYTISNEDFKWVERLFPPSRIPQPPEHQCYPTPSGWIAPANTIPNKPYFVRRTNYHSIPIVEKQKPVNSQRWITMLYYVEGDIFALEKELIEVVRPYLDFDPATKVNELSQTIWIKGLHLAAVEKYLLDLGF